jgi:hypothetical protein
MPPMPSKTRKLIETLLENDTPVSEIAARARVASNTVYRVRDEMPRDDRFCRCGLREPCSSCLPPIEYYATTRRDRG